jgi:anti-anti-sigma regulatory factor
MGVSEAVKILVPDELFEQEQADGLQISIEKIALKGHKKIELDFSNCRATSAYGLNVLALQHAKLMELGGSLAIIELNPSLKEVLENIAFDTLMPISGKML